MLRRLLEGKLKREIDPRQKPISLFAEPEQQSTQEQLANGTTENQNRFRRYCRKNNKGKKRK